VSGFSSTELEKVDETYYAAITTGFEPDIFGVNFTPKATVSLLKYSLNLPV
jgi:hypothetical protein